MFEIRLSKRAEREFNGLSNKLKQKFYKEFKRLSKDFFNHPQVKKFQETKFGYRLRIGRWRVLISSVARNQGSEERSDEGSYLRCFQKKNGLKSWIYF